MFSVEEYLALMTIHVLALMSPGPDFAMVLRSSLVLSRKEAVWCAFGIACGILIHVLYSVFGISVLIAKSPDLARGIQIGGALYLIFVGIQAFLPPKAGRDQKFTRTRGVGAAIRLGFLTNLLNAKATLFFLSIFTQFISATTPGWIKALYGGSMVVSTFLWFSFLSLFLTSNAVRRRVERFQKPIEKLLGAALMALGVRIISLL